MPMTYPTRLAPLCTDRAHPACLASAGVEGSPNQSHLLISLRAYGPGKTEVRPATVRFASVVIFTDTRADNNCTETTTCRTS